MTDWERVPVFGERTGRFPARVRPSAYAIITGDDGRVAVVHTPTGYFLPGGGQDDGESTEATVTREAVEECALVIRVGTWRVAAIEYASSVAERVHFEKRSTFCDASATDQLDEPSEADHELVWASAADAADLLASPSHRWAVSEWSSIRAE